MSLLAQAACAMVIGLSGLCGSTAQAAESMRTGLDLALTKDGQPVNPEVWTIVTDSDGKVDGVLNYTGSAYEMIEGASVCVAHRLDLYARDGSFVRTVATDATHGVPALVAVQGGQVYLGRSDWANTAVDAIDRVVGGLAASDGAIQTIMPLVCNWAMSFAPDGTAYAMYNDGYYSNRIARLDLTAGTAQTVVEIGGYGSGFDLAPNGDMYFSTYYLNPAVPDRILRLTHDQLAAGLPVDLAAAEGVLDLPSGMGAAGLAVDEAGNVVFGMNKGAAHVLAAIYAGKDYSGLPTGYDQLATSTGWLGNVQTAGDVSKFDGLSPDNAAFTSGYAMPISYVPEPATMLLLAAGWVAGALARRRRR